MYAEDETQEALVAATGTKLIAYAFPAFVANEVEMELDADME
jgi:hypothetical protein